MKYSSHCIGQADQVGAFASEDQQRKWLVPANELSEDAVKKNFDPDVIGASVVPSPMRGIKYDFINLRLEVLIDGLLPKSYCEKAVKKNFDPDVIGRLLFLSQ